MTIEQIRYFLSLSQTLSFTKTAEIMYTTQPTISRQIKLFEKEMGLNLFFRKANGISLTPAGKTLAEKLSVAYTMIDDSIQETIKTAYEKTIELKVGCLISLDADHFIVECYKKFMKKFKSTHFVYEKHGFNLLKEKLKDGDFDLIITLDSKPNLITHAETRHLFDSSGVCIVSKNHPLAQKKDLSLSDLTDETIICLQETVSPRGLAGIKKICEYYNFKYKNIIQVPNLETVFFYVDAGIGIALLDKSIEKVFNDDFVRIDTPSDVAKVSAIVLWDKNNYNPAIISFVDILLKESDKQLKDFFK